MVGDSAHGGPEADARRDLQRVAAALGGRAERDRPLGQLTTYRVGGPAALYFEATSEEDLLAVRRALFGRRVPVLVLGKGSNMLVADAGFPGLVVRLGPALSEIVIGPPGSPGGPDSTAGVPSTGMAGPHASEEPAIADKRSGRPGGPDSTAGVPSTGMAGPHASEEPAIADKRSGRPGGPDSTAGVPSTGMAGPHASEEPAIADKRSGRPGGPDSTVRAGGGAGLPVLARRTVEAGLTGLEWAVGVPGSVGGAVRMNAGGHGADTASCLLRYRWLDLAHDAGGEEGPDRLGFGYRSSTVLPTEVVVWAEFGLRPGPPEAGRAALSEIVRWRREHQPGGSNAGSVFANPPGDSAGRLVEAAGLKGFRMGSAQVSGKHANFIQADDGGSADDVRRLMAHVRQVVAERFGVVLRAEVRLVGFPAPDNGGRGSGSRRSDDGMSGTEGGG